MNNSLKGPSDSESLINSSSSSSHNHHVPNPKRKPLTLKSLILSDKNSRNLLVMLFFTFMFFFVELVFGYASGSLSLVSDAFHMLGDSLSLGIALFAKVVSSRPAGKHLTYGYKRAEVLAGNINSVFLLTVCFFILIEAVQRIFEPPHIKEPMTILIVAVIGLLFNLVGLIMFHQPHHHHSHDGHSHSHSHSSQHSDSVVSIPAINDFSQSEFNSDPPSIQELEDENEEIPHHSSKDDNIHAVWLHVLGDFLGSIAVIISALYMLLIGGDYDWVIDLIVSVIITSMIIKGTIPLFKRTSGILLQETPHHIDLNKIRESIADTPGLVAFHDLHVWLLSQDSSIATLHAVIDDRHYAPCKVVEQVKKTFHLNGIHSSTIQAELVSRKTAPCSSCHPPIPYGTDKAMPLYPCNESCQPGCKFKDSRCCPEMGPSEECCS